MVLFIFLRQHSVISTENSIGVNKNKRQVQKVILLMEGLGEGGNEEGLEFVQLF